MTEKILSVRQELVVTLPQRIVDPKKLFLCVCTCGENRVFIEPGLFCADEPVVIIPEADRVVCAFIAVVNGSFVYATIIYSLETLTNTWSEAIKPSEK